jgi:hypothetical protein
MVSNAELPFTSLIKSSVLPSHASKMKKIAPGAFVLHYTRKCTCLTLHTRATCALC